MHVFLSWQCPCALKAVMVLLVASVVSCSGRRGRTEPTTIERIEPATIQPDKLDSNSAWVHITRVSKTEESDSFTVIVQYQSSGHPMDVFLQQNSRASMQPIESQNGGELTFQVKKNLRRPSHAPEQLYFPPHMHTYLHFVFPHIRYVAVLRLYNTSNTMSSIPRTNLQLVQGSYVPYRPGSDAQFDLSLALEGHLEYFETFDVRFQFTMQSATEENAVVRYAPDFINRFGDDIQPASVKLLAQSGTFPILHGTFGISSPLRDPEGILGVINHVDFDCRADCGSGDSNCPGYCLLTDFITHLTLRFYRQDHSGPFPEDFLGFVYDNRTSDPSRVHCDVNADDGSDCVIICEAAGSHASSARIDKVLPGGDVISTDDVRVSGDFWSSAWLVMRDVTSDDAGDFRCKAVSETREITRIITLVVTAGH